MLHCFTKIDEERVIVFIFQPYFQMMLLNTDGRRDYTAGEMVNMMSVDVFKIEYCTLFIGFAWSGPLQIIASLIFLYDLFGPSTFAGFGVLLVFIVFNMFASKYQKVIKSKEMVSICINRPRQFRLF